MDIFDQTRSPYVWSLITYFLTASAVGAILFAAEVKEVWFHDGTCIPFGAPTYLFFGLFQLQNLPFALIISPLWMTVRWLERTTQLFWFRQKHKNLFKR